MMTKSELNFLNRHHYELFEGRKIAGYGKVYWANLVTMEIYANSRDEVLHGAVSGYKMADITDDWQIEMPCQNNRKTV